MRIRIDITRGWGMALLALVPAAAFLIFAAVVQAQQMPPYVANGGGVKNEMRELAAKPVEMREPLATLAFEPVPVVEQFVPQAVSVEKVLEKAVATAPVKADVLSYGGKQYKYAKTIKLRVTAYAPDPRCCYPYDGTTTASGLPVTTNGGRLVAADTTVIPMKWMVAVPGYAASEAVPVLDRGGAIKGNKLDVLLPTFEAAKKWGVRMLDVKVYSPVK